jgi:mRNA interferase HigB
VRVISRRTLREFWGKHADSEEQLKAWFRETQKASWRNINELKAEYTNASILKDNRIVFNIKGNNYRLIVKMNFEFHGFCLSELMLNMIKLTLTNYETKTYK